MNITAPKSTIDVILDKLQPSVHAQLFGSCSPNDPNARRRRATLVADCEEALRVLQVKRASMPKKDTALVRGALVIDYVSRTASSDDASRNGYLQTAIPATVLAQMAGFQKKDMKRLEEMRTVVASYLGGTSIGTQSHRNDQHRSQKRRKHEDSLLRPGAATLPFSNTVKPTLSPSHLIRDLCIQLGPMIPDAEFVASYAERLFDIFTNLEGVELQANRSGKRLSKYELRRDMEGHQEYYEAVFLYLAVKRSEGDSARVKKMSKKKLVKKIPKSAVAKDEGNNSATEEEGEEEEEEEEGDDDRPLHEADVVRASNLLEGTFATVLDYVKDWIEVLPAGSLHTLNKAGETSGTATKTLFQVTSGRAGSNRRPTSNSLDNVFEQWKQKVLHESKTSVSKNRKGGDAKDWLTIAADEVLHKAGLQYN